MIKIGGNFLELIPNDAGVYKYYDAKGSIIYIGKAKNLRRRVGSYFREDSESSAKVRLLVSKIATIDYVVVGSEEEALLLENNLIKENQPKYNILLKDDKSYPWICITKEEYPRIFTTRKYYKGKGEYFGPFISKNSIDGMLRYIRRILPYRSCKSTMTEERVKKGMYSVCLEYHIKNCLGCCEGHESREDYNETINQIRMILRGRTVELRAKLKREMEEYSENLEFEKAEIIHKRLKYLEEYESKQIISNPKIGDLDVVTLVETKGKSVCNYMQVRGGYIIMSVNKELKNAGKDGVLDESSDVVARLMSEYESDAKIIISNERIELGKEKFTEVPIRGNRKKLVELGIKNCEAVHREIEYIRRRDNRELLENLQRILKLSKTPRRIECVDNSNLQGTNPVTSLVVFVDGKPKKSEYRIYNVKNVKGIDDYATMEEFIERRYTKLEREKFPNLLIVDGGKGQLNSALTKLKELKLENRMEVISLAERIEEVYVPRETYPIYLDKTGQELKLLQRIRDEAHRVGINAHRRKRVKEVKKSELENIKGIGKKSIEEIYKNYSSLDEVLSEGEGKLSAILGTSKANLVLEYLQEKKGNTQKPLP